MARLLFFHPLPLLRRPLAQRLLAWTLLLGFLPVASGGCNYYRTRSRTPDAPELSHLADNKQFIMHQGSQTWQLNNPRLDRDNQVLTGFRVPLSPGRGSYLEPEQRPYHRRYLHADRQQVLNLVHLYLATDPLPGPDGGTVRVPLTSIQRLDIVEADTGRTIASHVLTTGGVVIAVYVTLLIIIVLTKSSCPFVYAQNGQGYEFVGEAYGGAIFRPAERDDYLPLPAIVPTEAGDYELKISNELKERQYTDLAELWVADHPAGCRVLLDSAGRPHTLRRLLPPLRATAGDGGDRTRQLKASDRDAALFDDPAPAGAPSQLMLRFARPPGARAGKLVLHAQNSLWLDHLYGRFIEHFGSAYNSWADQQRDLPAGTNARWASEQHVPLAVYCRTTRGWQRAGAVPPVGPLAGRDLVVPLDFGPGSGPVEVRLETGFMFWEVDYAALDCTPDEAVTLERLPPRLALTEHRADVRTELSAADGVRLVQPRPGTEVRLSYRPAQPAPAEGQQRSVFLRTRGYYEHIRQFSGLPDLPALYAFRRPGRLSDYSQQLYWPLALPAPLASAHP